METLPAWKITHFSGEPARGRVYAYLRCYVREGALPFGITVFDRAPRPTARFGFAVSLDAGPRDTGAQRYLFFSCAKQREGALWLYRAGDACDTPVRQLTPPALRQLAGGDEQGFYWGAEGVLPAELFCTVFGRAPRCGDVLPANAFLYDEAEAAFGAAAPVPPGRSVPTAAGLDTMVVVPY